MGDDWQQEVERNAKRLDDLEMVVETIVRNLEAGCRLVATALHDLPVLDRETERRAGLADRRG